MKVHKQDGAERYVDEIGTEDVKPGAITNDKIAATSKIGLLADLETSVTTTIVAAINSIKAALGTFVGTWLSLTDTPDSYEGQAGKFPIVNDSATGIGYSVLREIGGRLGLGITSGLLAKLHLYADTGGGGAVPLLIVQSSDDTDVARLLEFRRSTNHCVFGVNVGGELFSDIGNTFRTYGNYYFLTGPVNPIEKLRITGDEILWSHRGVWHRFDGPAEYTIPYAYYADGMVLRYTGLPGDLNWKLFTITNGDRTAHRFFTTNGGTTVAQAQSTGVVPLVARMKLGPTADGFNVQTEDGMPLFKVTANGNVEFHKVTSTDFNKKASRIESGFTLLTDAYRTGYIKISVSDYAQADRVAFQAEADGTGVQLGWFGNQAIQQGPLTQPVAGSAGATYDSTTQDLLDNALQRISELESVLIAYGLLINGQP